MIVSKPVFGTAEMNSNSSPSSSLFETSRTAPAFPRASSPASTPLGEAPCKTQVTTSVAPFQLTAASVPDNATDGLVKGRPTHSCLKTRYDITCPRWNRVIGPKCVSHSASPSRVNSVHAAPYPYPTSTRPLARTCIDPCDWLLIGLGFQYCCTTAVVMASSSISTSRPRLTCSEAPTPREPLSKTDMPLVEFVSNWTTKRAWCCQLIFVAAPSPTSRKEFCFPPSFHRTSPVWPSMYARQLMYRDETR